MTVFRGWLGLAFIVMALLLTACGNSSTPTGEEVATSSTDEAAQTSTESEERAEEDHEHDYEGLPELKAVALAEGERLRVVATTSIVGDVVAQVGRDGIELIVLMEPGQDPHSYQSSAMDSARAAEAHVIFVNGLGLEEGLLQELEGAAENVPLIEVSAGIKPMAGEEAEEEEAEGEEDGHDHAAAAADPHFWFDVANVQRWTEHIEAALGQLDPNHLSEYEANAAAYEGELAQLDSFIRERVAEIPAANRKLVTNHDSFGYFANAYGFEVIGTVIPSLSSSSEPSASDLSDLIETINNEKVAAIFIETTVSDKLAEVVSEETGATVHELYSGAIGVAGSGADSYIGMMRANVETIREALE